MISLISHPSKVMLKIILNRLKPQARKSSPKNRQASEQTNNITGIKSEIKVNGQKLETVTSFKYLGSIITDEGSKPEILSRITVNTDNSITDKAEITSN